MMKWRGRLDAMRPRRRSRQSQGTAACRAEFRCGPAARVPPDSGRIAANIGTAALELARQANSAGLTTLGYLLESAALEAGAEAASVAWRDDAAEL